MVKKGTQKSVVTAIKLILTVTSFSADLLKSVPYYDVHSCAIKLWQQQN